MIETLQEDYIRTARARGNGEARVIWRHALKNAILPVITMLGLQSSALLGGSIVVETVFAWPGLGQLSFEAIASRDVNLLLGILLSRVVSGFVAEQFGWRAMFVAAAVTIVALGVALSRGLPRFVPSTQLAYRALLGSLATLWRQHPGLRRAAMAQGLLSLGFSAFWSTLAVMLHGAPFHLGAGAAGAFGLAGAAGALAAPLAGRVADTRGPMAVASLGAGLTMVSFAAMLFLPLLSPHAALCLIAGSAVGFDLGIQTSLIAHQSIVYGIDPAARSRLNAILMTGVFIGMAAGGALGSLALAHWGWTGVTLVAASAAAVALALRLRPGVTRNGHPSHYAA
ncbi:hypothetical protein G6F57_014414 [Rhizopus arrhizus]|nr:hypothetical protein G6F57_014414 [Rhizopus arrhizus]